ncbi:MAG TPA: hypothetical protein VK894_14615 [Jiangellales bacterium]|nr:hypothetical protein [Jiangellales bacterium]
MREETPGRVLEVGRSRLRERVPHRLVAATPAAVAAVLAVAYLLAPPMGEDLAAHIAHADAAREHWPALLDLRWYGGFDPLGYSVLSPPLTAVVGVRLATALAYLAGVVLLARLLRRLAMPRPVLGGMAAALALSGDLATGRTAFAIGLAVALGSLLALAYERRPVSWVLAVVAALASPLAGLLLGICAGALFLAGHRRAAVPLGLAAMTPTLLVAAAFGNGGRMPFAARDALAALAVCTVVVVACWAVPAVRWGAALTGAVVAAAFALPTPLGSNAGRLPELLGPVLLVGVAPLSGLAVAALTAVLVWLLPPVDLAEVRARGEPGLDPAAYASLVEELRGRGVVEPVEVVPMQRHGEAAEVARVVPLARGWLRQVDVERNPLFYDEDLDEQSYGRWLDDNAVAWVAVARSRHDWAAGAEAALVRSGLPYLEPVWGDATWRLYRVRDPRPVVSAPGRVVARDSAMLTVELPRPGAYELRVAWSRWLSPSRGCVQPAGDGWTVLVVDSPGVVDVGSSLLPRQC